MIFPRFYKTKYLKTIFTNKQITHQNKTPLVNTLTRNKNMGNKINEAYINKIKQN